MLKMKRITAILLSLLIIFSLASCKSGSTGSVYWLNFKPELDETLRVLAEKYTKDTGVSVKIVTAPSGTYQTTLREEMHSDYPPTLFVINDKHSADEWGAYALDLSDTEVKKQLNTSSYNMTDEEGGVIAIPYCIECYGIAVNPGLLELAGYSVDDITGFDSLKEVARMIHANADYLGFDAFCSCDLDAENSWRITGHLANIEYSYEQRAAGSWVECPASLTGDYMPYFKNLYDLCINNSVSEPEELAAGGHDPSAEFISGKAAFFLTGSWDYTKLSQAIPDVTIIPYYCGVKGEEKASLNSGSENYWAVNSRAELNDQRATLDFMNWLVTDEEASGMLSEQLGNIPFKKAAKTENGFLDKQNQYVKDGCYKMEWATNYQPDVGSYRADLVTALTAYNADQSDENWNKVRAAMIDGWADHYAKVNN